MALKPWYKVVTPREDLREGRPLDASEFAVHLDPIRDGNAPADYQEHGRQPVGLLMIKVCLKLVMSKEHIR